MIIVCRLLSHSFAAMKYPSCSFQSLKNCGWFKNCKGIIYGRAVNSDPIFDYQTIDVLKDSFLNDNIPVVYGCDFGHLPPSWAIIAGSIAHFDLNGNKAKISYELR